MQSFRQWLDQQLTTQRQIVKGELTYYQRIKEEAKIAAYRKVLNEWVERGERA